jgi:Flp pilus assembly protein protease CpaA
MVLFFGIIEQKIYLSNLIVALLVLLLFMGLFLYNRNITVGGGDIKYLLVTAFYLKFTLFPVFLIITGLLQTAAILYTQNVRKRRFVPMLPIMFSSVIITDILIVLGIIK